MYKNSSNLKARFITKKKPTIFIPTQFLLIYLPKNKSHRNLNQLQKPNKSTKIAITPPMTLYGKIY